VYAGGAVIANDLGFEEFVDIFAPNQSSPRATTVVSTGSNAQTPPHVAIDGADLFVTNVIDSLREYDVKGQPELQRTITTGLNQPGPVAVDARERIYVGNAGGTVTVFAHGTTTPLQTLSLPDFGSPVDVILGP
jgi:hypothetical protein